MMWSRRPRASRRSILAFAGALGLLACGQRPAAPTPPATASPPTPTVVPAPAPPSPTVPAASPTAATDPIDAYVTAEMARRLIPGLALAVVREGKVVKERGYGLASIELDVPVTPDTVFELASVTKQFTAAAVMKLVEGGKVGLDSQFRDYVVYAPDKWNGITVRHLLTHTAGFPPNGQGFRSLKAGGTRLDYSASELFGAVSDDPILAAPGESYAYTDAGYFLLGMVIEKASGVRYDSFLEQQFFGPNGMAATVILDQRAIVKNRAPGYTLRGRETVRIRRDFQMELASHYGVLSTVRDLVKWDAALAGGKVLKQSSLDEMWSRVRLNDGSTRDYGFGWEVKEVNGHRVTSHAGVTGTEYARFPDDGLTAIVLTNLGFGGLSPVEPWGLTTGVASRFVPDLTAGSVR
jgi:CubicO group peptidase (beta-lactamase class C family)